jgi:hypothetical protein
MSKATRPSDTAYLLTFKRYEDLDTALVIAPNPIQAQSKLIESLSDIQKEGLDDDSIRVAGELRDRVKDAEKRGAVVL